MSIINIVTVIGAAGLFLSVLELVRRRSLREEYSLLWLFMTLVYIVIAVWPKTISFIADLLGIDSPVVTMIFIGVNFLLLILIQYSTRLSKLTDRYKDIAQQIAIIDHELSITSNEVYRIAKTNKAYFYVLAASIAARDNYSRIDIERKVKLIHFIGNQLSLKKKEIEALEFATILHDIGKIQIPISALYKTSQLSNEDWEEIKKHPLTSVAILEGIPFLLASIPIIQYHHEHWDGSGYPEGLHSDQIPVGARILGLADSLVALTSDRPYRNAMPIEDAFDILDSESGKKFDPKLIDLLDKNRSQVAGLFMYGDGNIIPAEQPHFFPTEEELLDGAPVALPEQPAGFSQDQELMGD